MGLVKVYGVPTSAGSRSETAQAIDQRNGPAALRHAFQDMLRGFDIPSYIEDCGDLKFEDTVPAMLAVVEECVYGLRQSKEVAALIGGSHTLTLGTLRALSRAKDIFSFIYFDAHPDMMPREDINYGSSIYHALKEGVVDPSRMCLVGARWIEQPERKIIEEKGIFCIDPLQFEREGAVEIAKFITQKFPAPYFLSIDLDAVDSCLAPGTTAPTPGGLTFRELQFVATELAKVGVVVVEIVELSPVRDVNQQTARQAASLLHSISRVISWE